MSDLDGARLPFDPIERAAELWAERVGDPSEMKVVTSLMRVQQMLLARIDGLLRPFGVTFARYEVLVLLSFSRRGSLPLSKIGARLMVHPTSVTNAIDRLEAGGLVRRVADTADRRRTLAELTPAGREVLAGATRVLQENGFGLDGLARADSEALYGLLRSMRGAAGDFPP